MEHLRYSAHRHTGFIALCRAEVHWMDCTVDSPCDMLLCSASNLTAPGHTRQLGWHILKCTRDLTTQQRMPRKCILFSFLCRKLTAKRAANSISAPLIIWYTEAVTERSPMFINTVAMRSKNVGMASMKISFALLPLTTAVSLVSSVCTDTA